MRKRKSRFKLFGKFPRKSRKNKHGVRKKHKLFIGIFFLFCIIGGLYYLSRFVHIRVNKISCSNQYGNCDHELTASLQELLGNDLFIVKTRIKTLLETNVLVEKYSVGYKIPDSIGVNIIERKPVYAIGNASGFLLVDRVGMIIKQTSSSNLPTLIYDGNYAVGLMVDEDIIFLLELTKEISSYYNVVVSEYDGDVLKIHLEEGPVLVFPSHGDKQLLIGSANLILLELNSEDQDTRIENSKQVKSIDLRYKNPVLGY